MHPGLRERRLGNEWKLLQQMERANPTTLEILGREPAADGGLFRIALHQTCGIIKPDGQEVLASSHTAEIRFPRFFPSVPIEARLLVPVFHPNVDPQSGFVCLWDRFSAGDTIFEAARRLQQIITWKLVNLVSDHVLQPEAVEWYRNSARARNLPLDFTPVVEPETFGIEKNLPQRPSGSLRRRLGRISEP